MRRVVTFASLCLVVFASQFAIAAEDDPKGGPEQFKYLKYRSIGPAIGGRVSRSAGVSGDPLIYYAATAQGGVWKTSDGGLTWKPIFDDQPVSSIGSIAVAPSDPNVIYVGTGEANIRGNVAAGNGIYKSGDGGKTWHQVWKQEGQIGTMIVHPTNPDIAFAAVLGHAFGPNPERGVYRTTDGGKNWQRVLSKNEDTGASDVCFDPSNPRILFAGLWQARRRPWELTSGGPGSGLYRSADGGDTWKKLDHKDTGEEHWGKGLPEGIWGKVCVAVAPSDGRRVYAMIEADKGGLYRSDDSGETWSLACGGHYLRQRAWYYTTFTVDPLNADVIWVPQVRLLRSIDGGKTFAHVKGYHHGDLHDVWIDPKNPKRVIASNDGGVDISTNAGETWYAPPLPVAQLYHVAVDSRTPYNVACTMQDIGTAAGPSNSLAGGGIALSDWHVVGGGEAGHVTYDPANPEIVYAGEYGGYISRYDHRTRQTHNISPYPADISGHGAEDMRYRFQWTAPILTSPHEPNVVYHAGNVLFRSADGGQTWNKISDDLTRNDRSKQKWSGGPITGDNTGAEYYCTIFAIAESPLKKGVLWAGSDDGLLHVTQDGGSTWTDVTKNLPGMPYWGTICCIEPSPFDAGTTYVVVDNHRMDDSQPYLYKTTDFGQTWKSLTAKLPREVYLHVVREDPKKKGTLYVGTERGIVYSTDDGANWQELKLNLPTVAVQDLVVKDNDLVVGTSGRSIWVLDDLSFLRDWMPKVAERDAYLFPVQSCRRFRQHESIGARAAGPNAPEGAVIHYYLKTKPADKITLEILDSDHHQVAIFHSKEKKDAQDKTASAADDEEDDEEEADDPDGSASETHKPELKKEIGVQRFVWDLRYKGPEKIHKAKIDAGDLLTGPLVVPGMYTVRLTVAGKSVTAPVRIELDPRLDDPKSPSARAHVIDTRIRPHVELALKVRDDLTEVTRLVNQVRAVRKQIEERQMLLKDRDGTEELARQSKALLTRLDDLEAMLHNPKAEVTYDILAQKGGAKLYSQLGMIYDELKNSDNAPTQGLKERVAELTQDLEQHKNEVGVVMKGDVPKLNELARKLDLPTIYVPPLAPPAHKEKQE